MIKSEALREIDDCHARLSRVIEEMTGKNCKHSGQCDAKDFILHQTDMLLAYFRSYIETMWTDE